MIRINNTRMMSRGPVFFAALLLSLFAVPSVHAQKGGQPQGPPPAKVVIAEAREGTITPSTEFVGTVYYREVSDTATEVEGTVEAVFFDEGRRVKQNDALVKLSSDILEKRLASALATRDQTQAELEKSRIDFKRIETLYKEESVAEQLYDDYRFRVTSLEKKALSLDAEAERLEVELKKMTILAAFDGLVIKRHVERGEWLAKGAAVATIARDDEIEVVVEVPEETVAHVRTGTQARITAGGRSLTGTISAVIARGDVATRTFPVKVRARNSQRLIEGMEARVTLPGGRQQKAVLVPRDAVITVFGKIVVFTVKDAKAAMVPVQVLGYEGLTAGVRGEGLSAGMQVVVKGNERLRDGQDVSLTQGNGKEETGGVEKK